MTIHVRMVAQKAMAVAAGLRGQISGLGSEINKTNRMTPLGQRHLTSLMKFGNQLQWTGRMLQYNFTLPILLAGGAATKFALDQEKAMVHVAKVYGDTEAAAKQFRKEMGLGKKAARDMAESIATDELDALGEAFTALSNHYGVQKTEVLEIAGAWAAAGASGLDLAESVRATMDAMIIGDMEAADATKALISIQAQYNLSTKELAGTLAHFNSIENATGASMKDLIIGMEKAAGVARDAGIDTRQLAAYMAALVPATGSAASAGNALKTVISRLMSPTKEAKQVMEAMGMEVTAMNWQNATASERLKMMADEFNGMGKSAKSAAASVIASRWQVNRFSILMREITNETGYYAKALKASTDQGESFRRMQKELNTVLESDPRRMQRMLVMLQNAGVEIIQPLIPHIIYLVNQIAKLAQAFADLAPETQKLVLFLALALAAIGPFIRYMGALWTLVGVLGFGFGLAGKGVHEFGKKLWSVTGIFKQLGTVMMGALGYISSGLILVFSGIASVFTGAFGRVLAYTVRFWTIQVGIWKAGAALLLIDIKLLHLSFLRYWVAISLTPVALSTKMWTTLKLITTVGLVSQSKLLTSFFAWWTRMWALTATVTTNIWGRMMVAILLLSKTTFKTLGALMMRVIPVLFGPWGIAIAAVLGILYAFRNELKQIFDNVVQYVRDSGFSISDMFHDLGQSIVNVFNMLPQAVQDALVATVTVIREAALAIYDWFQYINPWAQHSPSLVENVETGMSAVMRSFGRLSDVKGIVGAAYAEIKKFGNLTANLGVNAQQVEIKESRTKIKKAGGGAALQSFDKLQGMLGKLRPMLAAIEGRIKAQETVVGKWEKKLEKANERLDRQREKLDQLQAKLDKYQQKLDDAQEKLSYFASAPLQGMRAMEDQIFANTMAQNSLRLEMMKMEDAVGTLDQLKSKMEAINGAQELMRGTQADLRSAGAGSEILGFYDDEISKLEEQKGAYEETFNTLNQMQSALDALSREAERLDLVKSLQFDVLTRQIEQAADTTKELSFEEIMAGIAGAKREIEKYTPLVEEATKAVQEQEEAVARAEAARDRIQERLEKEQAAVEALRDKYNEVNDAISAIEGSINDVVSAAEKLNDALEKAKDKKKAAEDAKKAKDAAKKPGGSEGYISPGLQNFLDAGKATFPDPGGKGIPPRTDWSSQAEDIKKFTEQLGLDTAEMFDQINPFKPLKAKAMEVWGWIKEKAKGIAEEIGEFFSAAFDGVGGGDTLENIKNKLTPIGGFITQFLKDILKWVKVVVDLLLPEIKAIGQGFWDGLKSIWEEVGPKLEEFKELWEPIGQAISNFWTGVKPIIALMGGAIVIAIKLILSVIGDTIGPLLEAIGKMLGGVIDVIKGFIKIVTGIFTGDWKMIWSGIVDIAQGVFNILFGVIEGAGKILWGIVTGIVSGIVDTFSQAGISITNIVSNWWDDIVSEWNAITGAPQWFMDNVWTPIKDGIIGWWAARLAQFAGWWGDITGAWDNITSKKWWRDEVWQPIQDGIVEWWAKRISDFAGWWGEVKKAWNNITSRDWWHDNVWEPIKNGITTWWAARLADFAGWWAQVKDRWSNITSRDYWHDNVWEPIKNGIVEWWAKRLADFAGWWENIKGAWDNIKTGIGNWWETNVTDPIYNKITGVWTRIANWFDNNPNVLKNAITPIVKSVISAINFMIRGLNKVADVLPGDLWNIDEIPTDQLAAGGPIKRKANRGFVTPGARAIVGEGKANYPEYVIPTDPTYRNRAKSLLAMAAQRLGADRAATAVRNTELTDAHGIPMYSAGGWLKDKWDSVKNLGGKIADLPKDAVSGVMNKVLDKAVDMVNKIDYQPVESPPEFAIQKLRTWVTQADKQANDVIDSMVPSGGNVPVPTPDMPDSVRAWKGGLFTRRFIAHMEKAEQLAGSGIYVMQGGFRPPTSYSGTSHQADAVDLQPNNALIVALRRVGIAAGDRTGLGDWDPHTHAIPGPSAGTAGGSAVWQWQDYIARGGMSQPLNSPWGLAEGGIIKARRGGTTFTGGEAGQDEAVIPLPSNWRTTGLAGETHIHIHELVLPNITDPADVDLFIQNLENLARD